MSQEKRLNPNSSRNWLSAATSVAKEYPVNIPPTTMVGIDWVDAAKEKDGVRTLPWDDIQDAADVVGWPVFVRTDLASAKHHGIASVRAESPEDLQAVVVKTLDYTIMKDLLPSALLFRDWIDIDAKFTAFDGLPMGREFRVFADSDEAYCTHYYWPKESIEETAPSDPIWHEEHEILENSPRPPWMDAAARSAAFEANFDTPLEDLDPAWSVDFAQDTDGEWWLIDMAIGVDSWHPDDCPRKFDLENNSKQ